MSSVKFHSTRGMSPDIDFSEVVLSGVAPDGGLYVPKEVPKFSKDELRGLIGKGYNDVVVAVVEKFSGSLIGDSELKGIVKKSYEPFRHAAVAPVKQIGRQEYLMELFHGPTFAFKDFALQLLGNLIDFFMGNGSEKALIAVSTSGDTGSASIYGCAKIRNAEVVVIHPHEKVSDFQRRQMTTYSAKNVHCLAVKGSYDDCQSMIKDLFPELKKDLPNLRLISVNSINFARLVAQMAYYVYTVLSLDSALSGDLVFSVPTGNFGNIYSAFYVRQMGVPIKKLVCGNNSNDRLDRFFSKNDYSGTKVHHTIAPSMDITIASNFERFIYDLNMGDTEKTCQTMLDIMSKRNENLSDKHFEESQKIFFSGSRSDSEIRKIINEFYVKTSEVLDPHTAVAVSVGSDYAKIDPTARVVSVSTAHPLKFDGVIKELDLFDRMQLSHYMREQCELIASKSEKCEVIEHNFQDFVSFIKSRIK